MPVFWHFPRMLESIWLIAIVRWLLQLVSNVLVFTCALDVWFAIHPPYRQVTGVLAARCRQSVVRTAVRLSLI